MKTLACAAACMVAAGSGIARTADRPPGSKSMATDIRATDERAGISALEARWTAALIAKDEATLRELLAPEFQLVGIRSTGAAAVGRDPWLASAGSIVFNDFVTKTTSVEVFGDTALATVEGHWDIVFAGKPIKERFYVTDVGVRRDGRWQVVRRHSSPY